MKTDNEAVIVQQHFNVCAQILWSAISDPDQMRSWFFEDIADFHPKPGFRTEFEINTGNAVFTHQWRVTEAIPQKKLVLDWRYLEHEGAAVVTFEIAENDSGCMLQVSNEGLESFPNDIPEFSRESCEGGWKYLIQESLKKYLEFR